MTETEADLRPVAAVVVLAAGKGTRMKSKTSKLLHRVAGRSLLSYAVSAAEALQPQNLVVVVGHEREQVTEHLSEIAPEVTVAVQEQPNGTGDAVRSGLVPIPDIVGEVVVTYGDVPLLTGETLRALVTTHRAHGDGVTVLTTRLAQPHGYGRIIRDADGQVSGIVEQKDCTADQAAIDEVNAGIYVFQADVLRDGLASLTTQNAQGELYLTDVISFARTVGRSVHAEVLADGMQAEGVNDRVQLATLGAEMNRRICDRWMRGGVTIVDPATTWIEDSVDLAEDVTLLPGTHLTGATTVRSGAVIGPDTTLKDVEVDTDAVVTRAHAELAVIGRGVTVGPYAYLRPGTQVGAEAKVGAFVETKNAEIGPRAKVPHLTYCGDAVVGEGSNIGAGTIFANYDGVRKSTTTVGEGSFVGSNTVLVAPVNVGDGAYVAGGSTITEDVGPGELAIARGRQRNIPGWAEAKRRGTAADSAGAGEGGTSE